MKLNKLFTLLVTTIAFTLCVKAQDSTKTKFSFEAGKKIKVGFLVYDGVEAQDLNGPLDVFVKTNRSSKDFEIFLISATANKQIKTEGETVHITAQYSIDDAPQTDILIIPGAPGHVINDLVQNKPLLHKWMLSQNQNTKITGSVCTGSIFLANLGILNGHAATTHPGAINGLKKFTEIDVRENVRVVVNDKYITASGITSGIDLALQIVELIKGKEVADRIANVMVYNRNGDMSFLKK